MLAFLSPLPLGAKRSSPHCVTKITQASKILLPRLQRQVPRLGIILDPPNNEADWIFVDVLPSDPAPSLLTPLLQSEIEDDAKTLVRHVLRDNPIELSLVLSTDEHIQALNTKWRFKDAPTDVLSFPQNDPDQVVLGDLVVSVETAARQAEERDYMLRDEMRVLLVHGLLHLLGYDHEGKKEGDWLVMGRMENRILHDLEWNGEGLVAAAQTGVYRHVVNPRLDAS